MQNAVSVLPSGRTSFVIAHPLSTIRDADLILVTEAGQIVEQWTHTELLSGGGAYEALYAAQFAAPVVEVSGDPRRLLSHSRRCGSDRPWAGFTGEPVYSRPTNVTDFM